MSAAALLILYTWFTLTAGFESMTQANVKRQSCLVRLVKETEILEELEEETEDVEAGRPAVP